MASSQTNSTLLSQNLEQFQSIEINGKLIVLSAENLLKLGESTQFGNDYSKQDVRLYAESLYLSDCFHLKSGTISAHEINTGTADAKVSIKGNDGCPPSHANLHQQESSPGATVNGAGSQALHLYLEHVDVVQSPLTIDARGGKGAKGQAGTDTTNGGSGGNGGDGGSVKALLTHPYLAYLDALVLAYKQQEFDAKKRELQKITKSLANVEPLAEIVNALQAVADTGKELSQANTVIESCIYQIQSLADDWQNKFYATIDTLGGAYGVGGEGKVVGANGASGEHGSKSILQVGSIAGFPETASECFMFVHPSQCAMILEKIKLMYFTANPLTNRAGVVDMIVLLKRLIARTAIFEKGRELHALEQYYAEHEAEIGAINSIENLGNIHATGKHLLNQMAKGLDYFGYTEHYVPLTSFAFFKRTITELVDNFGVIENAYHHYFQTLAQNKADIEAVSQARDKNSVTISQASAEIEQLVRVMEQTARIIDSYAEVLPAKKAAIEHQLKAIKHDIRKYFDFNVNNLLSAVGMVAMAPESVCMWGAEIGTMVTKGVEDITSDKGYSVNKDYLVDQIKSVSGSIDSLLEAYNQMDDGSIAIDDPGASKLIAQEKSIMDTLSGFYSKFPKDMDNIKQAFSDYIDAITARNNKIMSYNAAVTLIGKKLQEIEQVECSEQTLDRDALQTIAPNLPAVTALMSQMYYDSRTLVMKNLDLTARAFRFWGLSEQNIIETAYGGKGLPKINVAVLKQAQNAILANYSNAIESFGANALKFPSQPTGEGVVVTIDDELRLDFLKRFNILHINLDPVRAATSKTESPFAGFANIRLLKVRVWLEGVTTSDNTVQVNITHGGKEKIVSANDTLFSFEHEPRAALFKYNNQSNEIQEDGDIGWAQSSNDDDTVYAMLGPFADWTVEIKDNCNLDLDLSGLTSVRLEFHGTNYAFN